MKLDNHDQQVIDIVRRAIQAPARQIAENAGDDSSVVVGKLLEEQDATTATMLDSRTKTW